jgi:hypothetical protein
VSESIASSYLSDTGLDLEVRLIEASPGAFSFDPTEIPAS